MPKKPIAYRGSEPFVFVSYAHADKQLVEPIIAGLHARGLRIWFDDGLDVGDIWEEVLAERVKQCAAMLCLVSPRFTDSNNCLDEIHNAKEQKKELLILHLVDEELPEIFRFRYSRFHALRLSAYPNQGELLDKFVATRKLRSCIEQTQEANAVPEESPDVLYQRGRDYYEGNGVSESYEEAVKWYRKAAVQGHPVAMYRLGYCYEHGEGVSQSYEEAVIWYGKAAYEGNMKAMCNLGYCYHNGHGVLQSYDEAIVWYRRAADKGDAKAMYNLGHCYEYGYGVPQSYKEAVMWYRQAADKGNAAAMNNLGVCYKTGRGVSQSYEEATMWYRRAANKGLATAMRNLENCYSDGRGVPKDQKQAEYWKNKANQSNT